MNRFLLTLCTLFALLLSLTESAVHAEEVIPTTTVPEQDTVHKSELPDVRASEELRRQQKNRKVPKNSYWDKVAWCETHRNWKDKGQWAGGLGIYVPTWIGYGGRDFAPTPDKATRLEQIVIANRIAVHGHQTRNSFMTLDDKLKNKPLFRYPVGFNGWGCIKNYIGAPKPRGGK